MTKTKINLNIGIPTCPVGCKYCMVQKIDIRLKYWKNANRIGVNKSCVFFNRLPQDPELQDMNFPWHLLDGEYLGYQGITDCFWNIFKKDLKYITTKVLDSNIRKLCLISKIPIDDEQINLLKDIKNKLIICYSTTGLDELENIKTIDRIKSLVKLRDLGFDVLPVMHPYIHKYTDAENLFKTLNQYQFTDISWKGFRYNENNMHDLKKYISDDVLMQYISNENEILIGQEYLSKLANEYKLRYRDLKEFLHRDPENLILNANDMKQQVEELLSMCVFSTSSDNESVKENCIKRRLGI